MSLNILIIEDEIIIAEGMKIMLQKLNYNVIAISKSYEEAISTIQEKSIDLALIDINLKGEKDGIDIAAYIQSNLKLPFIYITSKADKNTIDKAKDTHPSAYIIKPYSSDDLYAAIEIACTNFNLLNKNNKASLVETIFIKEKNMFQKIKVGEILFLKSDQNYTELVTPQKTFICRGTIKETLEGLDKRFIRIHKSYAVNLEKIDSYNHEEIRVENHLLPIGNLYKEEFLSRMPSWK